MFVFDLDGTLVDTREAVRQAYLAVGVVYPTGAWGIPWQEWTQLSGNDAERIHTAKNAAYPAALKKYAKRLPLLPYALYLDAPILTGASRGAVRTLEEWLGVKLNVVLTSATTSDKINWLNDHMSSNALTHVYVDDDMKVCRQVEEGTSWLSLVPKRALTLLSSQLARTHD